MRSLVRSKFGACGRPAARWGAAAIIFFLVAAGLAVFGITGLVFYVIIGSLMVAVAKLLRLLSQPHAGEAKEPRQYPLASERQAS